VDVGKVIVLAISLSIVGSLMAGTVFDSWANTKVVNDTSRSNYTGLMAVIAPFVPLLFGVGVLYIAIRELGLAKK